MASDTKAEVVVVGRSIMEILTESRRWLYLHGMLTDAENQRVVARLAIKAAIDADEARKLEQAKEAKRGR